MNESDPVSTLVKRLRAGDPGAAEALFTRYSQCLARVAEQHLARKLAGRVDGEDVVQSVFRTFFRRYQAGEFRIDTSAQLWRLLLRITLRKVRFEARFHLAAKRDAGAEAGDDALAVAAARDPGPEEAAELLDQLGVLLAGLPDLYAHVLDRRLQGFTVAEIAGQAGVSRQTVYRALDLLGARLVEQAGE